jgi:hypothetical protein
MTEEAEWEKRIREYLKPEKAEWEKRLEEFFKEEGKAEWEKELEEFLKEEKAEWEKGIEEVLRDPPVPPAEDRKNPIEISEEEYEEVKRRARMARGGEKLLPI